MAQQSEALAGREAQTSSPARPFPLVLLGRSASENILPGTAGVLLGSRRQGAITIEEVKPAPTEHRSGAAFRQATRRAVLEFMCRPDISSVVGFYRCQTGEESGITADDEALCERFFPDTEAAFLLAKTGPSERTTVALYVWRGSKLEPASDPFPVNGLGIDMDLGPKRHHHWLGKAAVLSLGALAAAALIMVPPLKQSAPPPPAEVTQKAQLPQAEPPQPLTAQPQAAQSQSPLPHVAEPPSPPAPAQANAATKPAADVESDVRNLLQRWVNAQQHGELNDFLGLYAPRLENYFSALHATREDVRDHALWQLGRYGRPELVRLTRVSVQPLGPDRASAVFRMRWQRVAGVKTYSGETPERMQFARGPDGWQIVAEYY